MQHNLKTSQIIENNSGKKIVVDIEYDFEKNCWIIQDNVTTETAVKIAKNLKKQYYTNKNWVVRFADLKTKVRFIDEVEYF